MPTRLAGVRVLRKSLSHQDVGLPMAAYPTFLMSSSVGAQQQGHLVPPMLPGVGWQHTTLPANLAGLGSLVGLVWGRMRAWQQEDLRRKGQFWGHKGTAKELALFPEVKGKSGLARTGRRQKKRLQSGALLTGLRGPGHTCPAL